MSDESILARLDALIPVGRALAQEKPVPGGGGYMSGEFYAQFNGWRAQSLACLAQVVGSANPYYERFEKDTHEQFATAAGSGAEILAALRSDTEAGYLRREADLVAAEVFTDFLDMAGHLLEAGYFHPAASLIGAVAEDGLRRIARNAGIKVGTNDDMNALNSKLRQGGVYSPLIAKRVTLWGDIRNNADHGNFDLVTKPDVDEMYKAVTSFLAERLG